MKVSTPLSILNGWIINEGQISIFDYVERPFFKINVKNLVAHFVTCGYVKDKNVFYLPFKNNEGNAKDITDIRIESWDNWMQANVIYAENL